MSGSHEAVHPVNSGTAGFGTDRTGISILDEIILFIENCVRTYAIRAYRENWPLVRPLVQWEE